MATQPVPLLEVDLADDGGFATDISAFVLDLAVEWGRRSPLEKVTARRATIILDNEDSRFTPKNTSGPFSPDWRKDKPINLRGKVTAPAIAQLLDNPSAENDVVGWFEAGGGVLQINATTAKYGGSCGRLTGAAGIQTITLRLRSGSRVAVTVGLSYVYTYYAKSVGAGIDQIFGIQWFNAGGSNFETLLSATFTLVDGGPWVRFTITGVAPATAVTAQVLASENDTLGVGDEWFSDAHLFYQGSDTTVEYLDGDSPGAVWAGTPHESTSSRGVDPILPLLKGFISDLQVERRLGGQICTLEITSARDYQLDLFVNVGTIDSQLAENSFNRVLDVVEGGPEGSEELFENPCFDELTDEATVLPSKYSLVGPNAGGMAQAITENVTVVFDGAHYLATGHASTPLISGDGWRYDMTAVTTAGKKYRYAIFLGNRSVSLQTETVALRMIDDDGGEVVQATTGVTLPLKDAYKYVVVEGTWRAGSTARYVELIATSTFDITSAEALITDCHHGVLFADKVPRDYRGEGTLNLQAVVAFQRSALALLNELADSVGGVVWEKGDGEVVVEDYQTRSATPVPKLRLTDGQGEDGFFVSGLKYAEKRDHSYTEAVVFSDGDLIVVPGAARATAWTLDPLPVMGNNEVRVYFVDYPSAETGGKIIGRVERTNHTLSAGAVTRKIEPFGHGAIVTLTAGGAGATLTLLEITAQLQQRQSARSRTSHVPSGAASRRFQRTLRLDMPMLFDVATTPHGTIMDTIATRAGDNFLEGQDVLLASMWAGDTERWLLALGRDFGDAVHVIHSSGPGNLAIDEVFQIEGGSLKWSARAGRSMTITWALSRASIQLMTTRRAPAESAEARQFIRAAPGRRQPL